MKKFLVVVRKPYNNDIIDRAEFDTPLEAQAYVVAKQEEGLRADILAEFK